MRTVIWPRTDGEVILDLREVLSDGVIRPALVAVDNFGAVLTFGKVVEVRDGGGHVELHRFPLAESVGFSRVLPSGAVMIHPENV